tara:strand:+ start:1244 stop:1819 length:576 start_codon:yes stop_codon:yes gene_type:complete
MTNSFSVLDQDEEDKSTSNLPRKLDKLKRKQEQNPTDERAKKIHELESIVNPPKPYHKKKKKHETNSSEDMLNKAYGENHSYWEQYRKDEEDRINKEREERIAKEKKEKDDHEENIRKMKYEEEERKRMDENIRKRHIAEELKKLRELPDDIRNFIASHPDKKEYRKLSLKYHPDKGGDEEHFKIINNHMN